MNEATELHFDGWVLRPRSGELTRNGATQRLAQQPLRALLELLAHPGEVVTRERLVEVLWPKGVVDFDNSLNAVMRKVRLALADDSETPQYVETLPRIGYRFIGKMGRDDPPPVLAAPRAGFAHRHGWLVGGIAVVAVVIGAFVWRESRDSIPPSSAGVADSSTAGLSSNRRAYELYLEGRFHRSRRDANGNPLAIEKLEAALREDPYFAEAWAALSETYTGAGITQNMPIAAARERARNAALRALEIKPELASAHTSLATIKLHLEHDLAGAEEELRKALALDDGYGRTWHTYGLLRGYQGRTQEAFEYLGRARELEPTTLLYAANYANLLYYTRRFDDSIEYIRPLLASQPRFDQVRGTLIRALVATGDVKGALEQVPLRFAPTPVLSDEGFVYAHAGRRDDALREVERLRRRAAEGYSTSYEIAIVYAALGQIDEACTALRGALEDHSQTLGWLRLDPRMDPLRNQQCYGEVSRRFYGP